MASAILLSTAFAFSAEAAVGPVGSGERAIEPLLVKTVVFREIGEDPDRAGGHFIDIPLAVPDDLAVPVVFTPQQRAETARVWPLPIASADIRVLQDFPAIEDDNSFTPPDTSGAAGPNHLLVALNTQIRVQSRAGVVLHTAGFRSFFDSVRNGQRVFDPRVAYDVRADRWIICAVADDRTTSSGKSTASGLLIGLSQTADPLGPWIICRFAGDTSNLTWLDYPQLGYDDDKLVVSTNVYSVSDNTFQRTSLFVISRTGTTYNKFDLAGSGGSMTPTVSLDPGSSTYLIQQWNGNFSGSGYARLYSVSSVGVSPIAFVQTTQTWATDGGPGRTNFAPQLAAGQLIDAGDGRMHSAVLRNGSIWVAQTIFLPAGAPVRSSIQWWQISPSGALQQRGLIDDPSGSVFYAYPSLAVNRSNDVLIGGSRFSSTTFASSFVALRAGGDPPNTISAPIVYKHGLAPYYKPFTSSVNRWGDYSTTLVDPSNDLDFWTVQEYAAPAIGGADRWGTWWARVAPATVVIAPPTNLQLEDRTPDRVTLSWSHSGENVTGFRFWYSNDGNSFSPFYESPASWRSIYVTNLAASRSYFLRITAFSATAESSPSSVVVVPTFQLSRRRGVRP